MTSRLAWVSFCVAACFIFSIQPAQAQPFPDAVPVVQWSFLQDEAVAVLEAQGLPSELTPKYARGKIRAYAFARLVEIIGKSPDQRSAQEQAAYDRLRSDVLANRVAIAGNARRFWESIAAGDSCFSTSATGAYVPPRALVSLFCELFQETKPNQREVYRGQGAAEAYDELLTGNGTVEVAMIIQEMDWFAARAANTSGPLFEPDSKAEKDYQAAMNIFRSIRGDQKNEFLLSLLNPELGPASVIAALLTLGTTVWDVADFQVIGNDLQAAIATAQTADPNLEELVDGPMTELLLVFMGEVLPPVPPGTVFSQPATRPCAFNAAFTCQHWNIRETDPDYAAERYAGLVRPNPEPGSYFALKRQGQSAWQASADLAPLLGDASAIQPWALPLHSGGGSLNGELGGASTRRQEPLPPGVSNPNDLRIPSMSGLSTFVADGLLVHTPADAGVASPGEWKYGTSLKYKNWRGEWWQALYVGGTFLHLRDGTQIDGFAEVGGYVRTNGSLGGAIGVTYTYCMAWTTPHEDGIGWFRDTSKVDGSCILLSPDFDESKLKVGDRIEIGGQRRTITQKVNCEGADLRAPTSGFLTLFIRQLHCDEGNPGVVLDPGAPKYNRTALIVDRPLASLVSESGPVGYFAVRKLEDVDTCARATTGLATFSCGPVFDPNNYKPRDLANCPRFGGPILGDSSLRPDPLPEEIFDDGLWANEFAPLDCFYSPMVRYKSTKSQNWSALYLPPAQAADDAYHVADASLVVTYANGVIMNDSIPGSASITDKSGYRVTLTRDAARGALVLNQDGSFGYTRGLAVSGDPYCGPAGTPYCGPDSFAYQVCADRDGRTDCATAEVALTVVNEAPRAFDVKFGLAGGKYVASYTYWDPEGDPEQDTTFTWTWRDTSFQTHVQTTTVNELIPGPTLQSVVKVEVTPMSSRGSWPDAPAAYGSDASWELEYGILTDCTLDFVASPNGQTQCVFSPFVNRPYGLPIPYQIKLGTTNLAYKFTPDSCTFGSIAGDEQIGTQTCVATLERDAGFSDNGAGVQTTASIWIEGVYPTGNRVHTTGRFFPRIAPATTVPIAVSVNPASGGSASCGPNPVPSGDDATCTASANPGWKFAGWTGHCTAVSPLCTLSGVTAARAITANFLPVVSAGVAPAAAGTVACDPNPVPLGGATTCIATPATGYAFSAWGGDCSGLDAHCQLAGVTTPKQVVATFVEVFPTADGTTRTGVPRVQVAGGNGWAITSADHPSHPTVGWIATDSVFNSPPPPPLPPGVVLVYPVVLDFALGSGAVGSTAQVTITYPTAIPPGAQYWKYGSAGSAWYPLDPAAYSISGNTVTLMLTDGGVGDNDGVANGFIVDPGALAMRSIGGEVRPIPVLGPWTLLGLIAMLSLLGARQQRQRVSR